jgi:hypothetical protein
MCRRTNSGVTFAGLMLALAVVGLGVVPLEAQRRPRTFVQPQAEAGDFSAFNIAYDGRFTFVRLRFTPSYSGWGRGGGTFGGVDYQWDHDYPRAERHLTKILSELTSIDPRQDSSNILALDDPELFKYPVAYMSEPGYWTLTDAEVEGFRAYLLKGGFVIFDDFREGQWANFAMQMRRVLPDHRLVQLDASHPIFHSFFEIETLEQFVHPYAFYLQSSFFGIFEDNDPKKRLMVIANYDNDVGESWEYSDTGFIPIDLTNEAYKLGINYIVYAMTH